MSRYEASHIVTSYLTWSAFMDAVREFPENVPSGQISRWQIECFERAAKTLRVRLDECEADGEGEW